VQACGSATQSFQTRLGRLVNFEVVMVRLRSAEKRFEFLRESAVDILRYLLILGAFGLGVRELIRLLPAAGDHATALLKYVQDTEAFVIAAAGVIAVTTTAIKIIVMEIHDLSSMLRRRPNDSDSKSDETNS
jgi:hypothetical protein